MREVRENAIARPRTHLYLIIDESSSMDKVRDKTIGAYNEFLDSHRRDRIDELFVTVSKFSYHHNVKTVYAGLPIEKAPNLSREDYCPGGMTALYDGMWAAIEHADKHTGQGDRVLVVLLTDGDDNDSYVTQQQILREVNERKARGNWTFTLLGANINSQKMADDLGVPSGNVSDYVVEEVGAALARADDSLKKYRSSDDLATDNFFHQPKKWKRPSWAKSSVPTVDGDGN